MFQITVFTEEERNKLIRKYGIEYVSIEWINTPENYPVKALRKYLEGDEFGVYKKKGIKIPFYLKHKYKKAKKDRERQIYIKFYKLNTNVRFGKHGKYYMFNYKVEKISDDDMIKMIKLLEKG